MLRFKPNGSDNDEDDDKDKDEGKDKKEQKKEYVVCPVCDGKGWAKTWDGKILDPCPLCNGKGGGWV